MTIEFTCECGEVFQVEDEFAGRKGRCPTCKRIMIVPEPSKDLELLELQDELEEETMAPRGKNLTEEPAQEELPRGKRVEEEVEVLRGWDLDGNDAALTEKGENRKRFGNISVTLPRPVLLGIPAGILAILILWIALRPAGKTPSEERVYPERPQLEAQLKPQQAPVPDATQLQEEPPKATISQTQEPPSLPKETSPMKPEPSGSPQAQTPGAKPHAKEEKKAPSPTRSPAITAREEIQQKAEVPPRESPGVGKGSMPGSVRPQMAQSGNYTVNVAAFKSQGMADAFADVLRKRGLDPFVWSTELKKGPGKMYRVSIGRFATKRQAELYAKELKEKHGFDTYVVKRPGT